MNATRCYPRVLLSMFRPTLREHKPHLRGLSRTHGTLLGRLLPKKASGPSTKASSLGPGAHPSGQRLTSTIRLAGMASPLIGIAAVNSLLFAAYGTCKRAISPFGELSLPQTALAGMGAGVAQSVLASPVSQHGYASRNNRPLTLRVPML